ncbi:Trimethyllysine dioxygenase [Pisolithus microcarpus]|nr:Trimethyllysine dioxygenase [Pisolithus microcarpus]
MQAISLLRICRLVSREATASRPVSSDQLGFVPEATSNPGQNDTPIVSVDDGKVSVLWSPQNWSRFHHIWLRDHCRCPSCFHPVTKQRLVNTFQIPREIKPTHHHASAEGLEIVWGEPGPSPSTTHHSSFYSWSWLKEHTYDPPQRLEHSANEKVLWGAKIARSPPTITYEEAMEEGDAGLYKWLSTIDRFGFCFVSGVPATAEATERLCERIGFIRETQYGKFWEFTADLAKGDTAYTNMALGAHTDTTYFTDPCGVQLFHLLSHTDGSGGTTLLVDGFYVASLLKELHPDHYDILSSVPIPAHASGEPTALYRPSPPCGYSTLQHDKITGELTQVRWNNDDRSVMSHLRPEVVEKWYDAIRAWNTLLVSPDSEYWVQMVPGTVLSINNHRVLHGRSEFDGKRRVCGAYIGTDEYRSKLTVLQEKFNPEF